MFSRQHLYGVIALVIAAAVLASTLAWQWWVQPLPINTPQVMELQRGDSLSRTAQRLAAEGLLSYPRVLVLAGRITGQTDIKFGEYQLQPGLTRPQLLAMLTRGDVSYRSVTLIEGQTIRQALSALKSEDALQHHLPAIESRADLKELSDYLEIEQVNPEGLFFPDTYFFTKGSTDAGIIRQAHQRLTDVLEQEWQGRAKGLPYKNAYEALIMASIVERETGKPSERGTIAGVFVRRLNKGMRLQTDPTVIYGMGDAYKGNIRRRDLKEKTAYNTYTNNGLPPTPIALAGREAIHAALHPEDGDALYFVAKGDGSHYFSSTLDEHTNAVRRFQLRRKKDYRSAPE